MIELPEPISDEQLQLSQRLADIFMPFNRKMVKARFANSQSTARFVHYTSADAATKILQSRQFWMRNAMCMDDYREMAHGHQTSLNAFKRVRDEFLAVIDECQPGIAKQTLEFLDRRTNSILVDTYITSLSEHHEQDDSHGRLSMWRGFSTQDSRIAIVLSLPWPAHRAVQALGLIFSPVGYLNETEVVDELRTVIANIKIETAFLQTVEPKLLSGTIFVMFMAAITCLKHEGFREELEWRALYCPTVLQKSPLMDSDIKHMRGVPQRVYNLPLDVRVNEVLADLDLARTLDRIIIGPTQYPLAVKDAFIELLQKNLGLEDASARVVISGIPLRT